ncbi:hypothetical protein J7E95_39310 [Streptomyces sp. ISL-14]|nr:hypothetical protein [Streptomyces sp. ISL-14]
MSAGLELVTSPFNTTSATAWLQGGTQGTCYLVTNRVTTSVTRIDDRSVTNRVKYR